MKMNITKNLTIESLYNLSNLDKQHILSFINPLYTQLKTLYRNTNSLNKESKLIITLKYKNIESTNNIYILYNYNNQLKLPPKQFFINNITHFLKFFYKENNRIEQKELLLKFYIFDIFDKKDEIFKNRYKTLKS